MSKLKILILWLITPLFFVGVSFWYISQEYITSKNLEYVKTLTWSDMNTTSFMDQVSTTSEYCYSFNTWVAITSSNRSFRFASCIDFACATNYYSFLYNYDKIFTVNTNIYLQNQTLSLKTSTTQTELNNFYQNNLFCFKPYIWYSGLTWGLFNTFYINNLSNSTDSNVQISVYRVKDTVVSDCSSVESQLSSCQSDYNTLSWSYNTCIDTLNVKQGLLTTCQTDLQSCQNWVDASCLQCQENLSGCLSDKTNLQNYNNSLSLQLNECLSNWGAWDLLSWDCQTFSLFWTNDNLPYSLPIRNNLFLPDWFQSYISWGVQAISKINKDQYSFDSFEDLYSWYDKIYLFLFGLPMFALFLYYVKTYFIYLFKKEK